MGQELVSSALSTEAYGSSALPVLSPCNGIRYFSLPWCSHHGECRLEPHAPPQVHFVGLNADVSVVLIGRPERSIGFNECVAYHRCTWCGMCGAGSGRRDLSKRLCVCSFEGSGENTVESSHLSPAPLSLAPVPLLAALDWLLHRGSMVPPHGQLQREGAGRRCQLARADEPTRGRQRGAGENRLQWGKKGVSRG